MTPVSILSICLAVLFAFLLGRSAVISTRRDNHNKELKAEVKKLNHRLDRIADSCLIKQFPFADDKEFAKNEAEELLDKLNEK